METFENQKPAVGVARLVRLWRDEAGKSRRKAEAHAKTYGKGNSIYVGYHAKADALDKCAANLQGALKSFQASVRSSATRPKEEGH